MDPSLNRNSIMSVDDDEFITLPDKKIIDIAGGHMREHMARSNPNNIELYTFLSAHCKEIMDDGDYNIIDQHRKKKWFVPDNAMLALISILEKFRVSGTSHGISQRQRDNARIYVDGDIKMIVDKHVTSDQNVHTELLKQIVQAIMENTVCSNTTGKTSLFVHLEARSKVTYDSETAQYKDGFHIRIATMFSHPFRKKVIEIVKQKCKMDFVFIGDEQNAIKNLDDIIDTHSASVPVLFPGGTKLGGVPYTTIGVYTVVYHHDAKLALVRKLPNEEADKINISLVFAPAYKDTSDNFTISPHVAPSFQNIIEKINPATFDDVDEDEARDISIMNINDPQAREIVSLLDLLARTRSNNYDSWFKIMIALAQYGQRYKPLARSFSIKSNTKYNEASFNAEWEKCLSKCNSYKACNIGTIRKMAKSDDPAGYKECTTTFITEKICRAIFEVMRFMDKNTAKLGDFHIAEILYTAFPLKYIGVPKRTNGGRKTTDDSDIHYYSMIMPGTPEYIPGAAYKYTEILSLAPLSIYISKKMPIILKQVQSYFYSCRDAPNQDETQIKKYASALGIIGKCYESCVNDKPKKNIMRQFAHLVTNFQFEEQLDSAAFAIGVYDAILETGVRPKIIRDISDYKLTRFTPSIYIPYDPHEKMLIETMQIYIDFVIKSEYDVLLYILLFQCRALNRKQKKLMLLNLWGNGSNGKSTIVQFMYTALGKVENRGYAYRLEMDYLVKERHSSGGAQSELMPLEHATYVSMSEPGDNDEILESKWKLLMSGESISARELYGTQRNIVPISVLVLGSNNAVTFSQGGKNRRRYKYDHGTLRRMVVVAAKKKFTATPNPDNPHEAKANSKILDEIVRSPVYAGALLSIMSIVHSLFIMIHNEDFDTVCAPNVEKQTASHINNIDTIDAFIRKNCVTGDKIKVKLSNIIDLYIAWHDLKYESVVHSRERILQAFIASRIEKKISIDDNGEYWCTGIRALAIGETPCDNERRIETDSKYDFESYEDFKVDAGQMLPFNGEMKQTTDARDFLSQLADLQKKYLAVWDSNHDHGVNYVTPN